MTELCLDSPTYGLYNIDVENFKTKPKTSIYNL